MTSGLLIDIKTMSVPTVTPGVITTAFSYTRHKLNRLLQILILTTRW